MALDIYFRYILELMVNQGHDGNLGHINSIDLFRVGGHVVFCLDTLPGCLDILHGCSNTLHGYSDRM